MVRQGLIAFAAAFGLLGLTALSAQSAKPEIFVYGTDDGFAWWHRKAVVRPMQKVADGITIAKLHEFEANLSRGELCFLSPVAADTYAGVLRKGQQEIEESFAALNHDPFFQTYRTSDGQFLRARIVLLERCDGERSFGLVVYTESRNIVFLDEWPLTDDVQSRSTLQYIFPAENGEIGTAQCFECGDASILHFDSKRKKFYWEYVGD